MLSVRSTVVQLCRISLAVGQIGRRTALSPPGGSPVAVCSDPVFPRRGSTVPARCLTARSAGAGSHAGLALSGACWWCLLHAPRRVARRPHCRLASLSLGSILAWTSRSAIVRVSRSSAQSSICLLALPLARLPARPGACAAGYDAYACMAVGGRVLLCMRGPCRRHAARRLGSRCLHGPSSRSRLHGGQKSHPHAFSTAPASLPAACSLASSPWHTHLHSSRRLGLHPRCLWGRPSCTSPRGSQRFDPRCMRGLCCARTPARQPRLHPRCLRGQLAHTCSHFRHSPSQPA